MFSAAIGLAFILAQSAPPPPAAAPRVYVQPALLFLIQPASNKRLSVAPNLSGHAPGVMVSAGGFLSRRLGLEGEVFYGGSVSKPQRYSYRIGHSGPSEHIDYTAKNRDLLFTELLRVRPRSGFEIVGGGGYARTTVEQVSRVHTVDLPNYPATISSDTLVTVNSLSVTGGVDLVVPASGRLLLTSSFRFRWLHRLSPALSEPNGVAPYSIQFGLGVRLK